jgi:hypothetical protein
LALHPNVISCGSLNSHSSPTFLLRFDEDLDGFLSTWSHASKLNLCINVVRIFHGFFDLLFGFVEFPFPSERHGFIKTGTEKVSIGGWIITEGSTGEIQVRGLRPNTYRASDSIETIPPPPIPRKASIP